MAVVEASGAPPSRLEASISSSLANALATRQNTHIEVASYAKKYEAMYSAIVSYTAQCIEKNIPHKIVVGIPTEKDVPWILRQIEKHVHSLPSRHGDNPGQLAGPWPKLNCVGVDGDLKAIIRDHSGNSRADGDHPATVHFSKDVYKLSDYVNANGNIQVLAGFDILVSSYSDMSVLKDYWMRSGVGMDAMSFLLVDNGHLEMTFTDILSISLNRHCLIMAGNALEAVDNFSAAAHAEEIRRSYPGNLWNPKHVKSAIKRLIEFLKTKLKVGTAGSAESAEIIQEIYDMVCLSEQTLMFLEGRLSQMEVDPRGRLCLEEILRWAKTICIDREKYRIVFEIEKRADPVIIACCIDPKKYAVQLLERGSHIILFSDALAEKESYLNQLGLGGIAKCKVANEMRAAELSTLIVGRGNDQMPLSVVAYMPEDDFQDDSFMIRNYGSLLAILSSVVPDNILCVFPNEENMKKLICGWTDSGIFSRIQENKLVLVEHPDDNECEEVRKAYHKAFLIGKGAIMCVTARGMLYETIRAEECAERALVFIGVPEMLSEDECTRERLKSFGKMRAPSQGFAIESSAASDRYTSRSSIADDSRSAHEYPAMGRLIARLVGRSMEGEANSTLLVLADTRFENSSIAGYLPDWIQETILTKERGKSIDSTLSLARECLLRASE